MRENLPLEMNFMHEASNSARVTHNFESVPNSPLYIPRLVVPVLAAYFCSAFDVQGYIVHKKDSGHGVY
jgi:hypothetical protein